MRHIRLQIANLRSPIFTERLSRSAAGSSSIEPNEDDKYNVRVDCVAHGKPGPEFENFDRVVKQYRTRVLRFLLAAVGDIDVAESLTQDCFLNAYKSRRTFRGECSVNT